MRKSFYVLIFLLVFFVMQIISARYEEDNDMPHGEISIECEQCHIPSDWSVDLQRITFKHETSGFPLSGAHKLLMCRKCHESLIFSRVSSSCSDCHIDIHEGKLGPRCDLCHNATNWENRQQMWEQHNLTSFPLVGIHALVDCDACHYTPDKYNIARLPIHCQGCHQENYQSTENPNHHLALFSTNCEECHPIQAINWQNTLYQHTTAFTLDGAHKTAACNSCHKNRYAGTSAECYACHHGDYHQTTDPDHEIFGFITTCEICHNTAQWTGASFDHVQSSGFILSGAHQNLRCTECHINNQTSGLSRDCFGCHENDYVAVLSPPHLSNNFDHNCLTCHNDGSWVPATFNHSITQFPLTGAHLAIACIDCHANGYVSTPSDCFSCHQGDFNSVSDPNHVQNNFGHDCSLCHTTQSWSPATFDHSTTQFPLTGAHISLACHDCHAGGYSGTPILCYACHQDDYNSSQNPNHASAGFPTTCETCHSTTNWNQTTWNHDSQYFPIYSGKHAGEWNLCVDCHVDPNNYLVFECIFCHEHNDPVDLGNKHREVINYQYNSVACYNCHPTGEE